MSAKSSSFRTRGARYSRHLLTAIAASLAITFAAACDHQDGSEAVVDYKGPVGGWPQVGGDSSGHRYSPNTQINRDNVKHLKEVWRFESGDVTPATSLQVTPILVEDQLVLCTPRNQIVSIDAETGAERWRFDAKPNLKGIYNPLCRGVAQARVEPSNPTNDDKCTTRIYLGTLDARLIALDAETGTPCEDFGEGGTVNLLAGIGETRDAEYYMTSPPVVSNGIIVTGAWVTDGQRVDAPGGVIRGWDARTGELIWAWDPVAEDANPVTAEDVANGATYTRGTANAWSLLSADDALGLVYLPMGNAAPDHYGGERKGLGRYASAVVALDIATGELIWDFKTVYHDVWDYDVASQPVLYTHPGGENGPRRRRWGTYSCSTAEQASRSFQSLCSPRLKAASPAKLSRHNNPSRRFPRHSIPIHSPTTTSGASRRSTARSAASSSRACETTAYSHRPRKKDRSSSPDSVVELTGARSPSTTVKGASSSTPCRTPSSSNSSHAKKRAAASTAPILSEPSPKRALPT